MLPNIPIFLGNLDQVCSKNEAKLVTAEISEADRGAPFVATFSDDDFLKIVDLLVPRVVYYETQDFDAKTALLSKARIDYEELFDGPEIGDDEQRDSLDNRVPQNRNEVRLHAAEKFVTDKKTKQFLEKWQAKNSTAFDLHVMFFANGVFHETKLMEEWFIDFENERDELLEQHKAIYDDVNDAVTDRLSKETEAMAKKLSQHPMFVSKGATKEKREYLAQQLFPDQRYGIYPQLVSRASSILWYNNGDGS